MIMLFYDFETSTRDFLGQILSFCFIAVDDRYQPFDEFTGQIRLNRTQLPDPDAIRVNHLNLDTLTQQGMSELEFAEALFNFLSRMIQRHGTVTLAGYNSTRFDLQFLRNTLIRYGFNPYFEGKLKNKDVLHFAQWVACYHEPTFPWVLTQNEAGNRYYGFKLDHLAKAFGLLTHDQSHDAKEDVELTIRLVQTLEARFSTSFQTFVAVQIPDSTAYQDNLRLGRERVPGFSSTSQAPPPIEFRYWAKLFHHKKDFAVINLGLWEHLSQSPSFDRQSANSYLPCIRLINPNKHFFVVEPLLGSELTVWEPAWETFQEAPFFKELTPENYFNWIKKDRDIEFQIHELGFERITTLRHYVCRFLDNPHHYPDLISELVRRMRTGDPKDRYLTQLFNRVYLNWHPNPDPDHLKRYLEPRYITGELYRNTQGFSSLSEKVKKIQTWMAEDSVPDYIQALSDTYVSFMRLYQFEI